MPNEQVQWLLKVIQPERTLASLPGGGSLSQDVHAGLLGLPVRFGELVDARPDWALFLFGTNDARTQGSQPWSESPRVSATATGRSSTPSRRWGTPPPSELLMGDGLHFTLAGQKRMALEVIRGWSGLQ